MTQTIVAPNRLMPFPVPERFQTQRDHCAAIWSATQNAALIHYAPSAGWYGYLFTGRGVMAKVARLLAELRGAGAHYSVKPTRQGETVVFFHID